MGLIRAPVQCESTGVAGASYEIKRQDVGRHLMVRVSGTKAKHRAVGFVVAGAVAGR